jgi:hypothetical protein
MRNKALHPDRLQLRFRRSVRANVRHKMSVRKKRTELLRLQQAFESEAAQFHDLSLSILYLTQEPPPTYRAFKSPNHAVMLWQYYGQLEGLNAADQFVADLETSNLQLAGIRGSQFSCFAIMEGPRVHHFLRMAKRAGSIFSEKEARRISTLAQKDFESNVPQATPVFVCNSNPLAIWLNHVLHHLGKTHPRYLPEVTVDLDPFAASLSAIDQLLDSGAVSSRTRPPASIELTHFRVALSFPGDHRPYVEKVASILRKKLGDGAVFYDNYYQPQLARPNLDVLLQRIYHHNSDLIVVFLCADYARKEWCGLEWRAVRDLIKQMQDDKLMLLRFDDASMPGLFDIDGYIDISKRPPTDTAEAILTRLQSTVPVAVPNKTLNPDAPKKRHSG